MSTATQSLSWLCVAVAGWQGLQPDLNILFSLFCAKLGILSQALETKTWRLQQDCVSLGSEQRQDDSTGAFVEWSENSKETKKTVIDNKFQIRFEDHNYQGGE